MPKAQHSVPGRKRSRWRLPFLLTGLAVIAVYGKSAKYPFVYFDDNDLIIRNFAFLTAPGSIVEAFKDDVFRSGSSDAYYRPLLTLSFMADAAIGGLDPSTFHITNIFIHLIAIWLAYLLFLRLGYERETALTGSLIYAVHPVLTQATGWIPGRNDSLLAAFAFLSIILLIQYARRPSAWSFTAHAVSFAAALFTKETAFVLWIFFPAALWMNRDLGRVKKAGWILLAAAWAADTVIWYLMRTAAFEHPVMNSAKDAFLSLWRNLPGLVQFIGKALIPANLSVLPVMKDTTFIYGVISCVLLVILFAVTKEKDHRRIAFGAAWFLLFLLPSFIRPNPDLPADFIEHRMYAPFFGGLIVMLELFPITWLRKRPRLLMSIGGAVAVVFGTIAFNHLSVFGHKIDFWQNAASHSPHYPMAHRNFGAMLYMDGMVEQAEKEYLASLRLNPKEPMARNNLGVIYMQRGDFSRAEDAFKQELTYNPGYDDALYNYGLLQARRGMYDNAVELWEKAIAENPDYGDAYDSLIRYYIFAGNKAMAIQYYNDMAQRPIAISPELKQLAARQLRQ